MHTRHHYLKKIPSRSSTIIAITGGIACGKSLICRIFQKYGFYVIDADVITHTLLQRGSIVYDRVVESFPDCVVEEVIDRFRLAQVVFNDPKKLELLEDIIHPVVQDLLWNIVTEYRMRKARSVIIEIQLLIESHYQYIYDLLILAYSTIGLRYKRASIRKGMTAEKFSAIIARQTPDYDKMIHVDYLIPNLGNLHAIQFMIRKIIGGKRKGSSIGYRNNRFERQRWSQGYRNRLCRAYK